MATQADTYGEVVLPSGDRVAFCRRCGAIVADTPIHTTFHATAAATAFPGGSVTMTHPADQPAVSRARTA